VAIVAAAISIADRRSIQWRVRSARRSSMVESSGGAFTPASFWYFIANETISAKYAFNGLMAFIGLSPRRRQRTLPPPSDLI